MARERPAIRSAVVLFILALAIRLVGVGLTTLTDVNPDQGQDTVGFANVAAAIAAGEQPFLEAITSIGSTYPTWGAILSPFWLLPGPSELYGQLFAAVLGAYAVYNVFLVGRWYHSSWAGWLAAGPVLVFPSFVAIHSTILRDVAILCALTLAVRLFLVPGRWRRPVRYAGGIVAILFATLLRIENGPVFGVVIATGLVVYLIQRHQAFVALPFAAIPVGLAVYRTYLVGPLQGLVYRGYGNPVDFLVAYRAARIREQHDGARTGYLIEVLPETTAELLAFAPIGAVYFLFVPFPWMIETGADLLAGVESLITVVYAVCAVGGVWYVGKRQPPEAIALGVGFLAFALLYGIISANVGTSIRQRQQLVWVLYLFGGVGMAARFEPQFATLGDRVRPLVRRVRTIPT